MKWLFTLIILFKILLPSSLAAQSGAQVSILSYNVENLFDTIDDPISRDSEFTPTGKKEWNSSKYWTKIKRLNKVFLSLDSCLPDLIALTEIENESVLKDIIRTNQFLKEYEFITYESGDRRGIQNAILYNKTKFKLLYSSIRAPRDSTGNILYQGMMDDRIERLGSYKQQWKNNYLEDAILSVRNNLKPKIERTTPIGCSLEY